MKATEVTTPSGIVARLEGEGPLLVLLAGFGQTSDVWTAVLPRLSASHTCVLVDNRGVGRSAGNRDITIEKMAGDIAEVIQTLGAPAAVLGWSMGGAVAQTLALSRPDLVSSLVLLSTAARRSEVQQRWTAARVALAASAPDRETAEITVLPWLFTHRLLSDHRRLASIARANAGTDAVPVSVLRAQAHAFSTFDVTDRLGEVAAPVLVVVGAEDIVTPVSDSIAMALALRDGQLIVLPQGGHAVVLETPAEVVAPILRFLRETAPSSSPLPITR
jgi:3-oxoadipate enol-lactonase